MRTHLASAALATTMVFSSAGVAGAAISEVDGGTWDHGVNDKIVWSHYFHPTRTHGSTAIGKFKANSGCVQPKVQSRATAPKKLTGNKAYYKFC